MNDLQKYLCLVGLTAGQIAEATGLGYHSVQKNIRGVRVNPDVREAISRYLGLSCQQLWAENPPIPLRRLIRQEINRKAEGERKRLQRRYL
jgi:hypothetical protein